MNIQYIKTLVTLMESLGFPSRVDKKIVYYSCLHQKEFTIKEQKAFGNNIMSYQIFFKENLSIGKLVCTHYDAYLRKNIQIESITMNKIDLHKLDERMKGMNWEEISQFNMAPEFSLSDKETLQQQLAIEEIILDLEALASTNEGKILADGLKYKYWIDLPLEHMIPNLYLLKSRLECTQRFYVIGEEGITAEEAYRFLNNRWLQRQMQIKKKNGRQDEAEHRLAQKGNKEGKNKKGETNRK